MGRAIGMGIVSLFGVRVAGELTYVPEHMVGTNKINSKVTIPVIMNTIGKNGERQDTFKLVAWGKLADICCRSLSKGMALDAVCEPQSYSGKLFDDKGNVRLGVDGQPIMVTKVSFTIRELIFGEESEKHIAEEIASPDHIRPINWNVKGHPDYAIWGEKLKARQALQYIPGSDKFGFARVRPATGANVTSNFTQPATPGQTVDMSALIAQAVQAQLAAANVNTNPGVNPAAAAQMTVAAKLF